MLSLGWICEGQRPDRWIRLTLVAISIILATLTFYFIEPPLRYGKAPKIKSVALFAVLLGLGALDTLATTMKVTGLDMNIS